MHEVEVIDGELWCQVTGHERYLVSSMGRVYSTLVHRLLKPDESREGHLRVSIGGKNKLIHRLVAIEFIPKIAGKPLVCHKDGNPKNNTVENLYWGTYSDNMWDSYKHGRRQHWGENCNLAKLTEVQVRQIRSHPGKRRHIAQEYGMSESTIGQIKRGVIWRHLQ